MTMMPVRHAHPAGQTAGVSVPRTDMATIVILLLVSPFLYEYSYWITSHYLYGDQSKYRELYDRLAGTTLIEAGVLQAIHTGSAEPLYWILMRFASNLGIDKDVWISLWNVLLMGSMVVLMRRHRANPIFIVLALCNFYLLVVMSGAERLKFALVFLCLGALCRGRLRYLFYFAALASHFQTVLFAAAAVGRRVSHLDFSGRIRKGAVFYWLAGGLAFLMFAGFVAVRSGSVIVGKIATYSGQYAGNWGELAQMVLLIIVGVIVLKDRREFVFSMLPLLPVIMIVGSGRVNIVAVIVFLLQVLRERRTAHPLILMLMGYFAFKSIGFAERVVETGDGFSTT